jgi:hypothetical protein
MDEQPGAPNQRTFSLNSAEAYEVLCPREDRPWILNGALPREPRSWGQRVIVETRRREFAGLGSRFRGNDDGQRRLGVVSHS